MHETRHVGPLVWGDEEARLAAELRTLLAERDEAFGGAEALRHVPVIVKAAQGRTHGRDRRQRFRDGNRDEEDEDKDDDKKDEDEDDGSDESDESGSEEDEEDSENGNGEEEGEKKEKEKEEEKVETVDEVERVRAAVGAAQMTGDVVRVNALIAGYAKDKRLHAAVHALAALLAAVDATVVRAGADASARPHVRPLRPTVYTLASFVNACANSDDADLASSAYAALTRAYGVAPNVVALTALVKVLANTGRVEAAYDALIAATSPRSGDGSNSSSGGASASSSPALEANLRTYNALLRGCLHFARGTIAVRTLAHMAAATAAGAGDARPDASSYECAVKALCCCGDVARAGEVISQMEAAGTLAADVSAAEKAEIAELDLRRGVVTNTVSAAAYAAYATACALLGRAAEALRALSRARAVVELRSDPELQVQLERQARGEARGLKRALLLARSRASGASGAGGSASGARGAAQGDATVATAARAASVAKFSQHQLRELVAELDLIEEYLARTSRAGASGAGGVLGGRVFMESTRVLVGAPVGPRRVDAAGVAALLGGARAAGQRRLHVELCSGYGDWLVARAAAGDARTLWVGAELLADRAHSVWARAALAGVGARVATVCADAVDLVCAALAPDSVDALYVNYPEPAPPGTRHFLEQPRFVAAARRALRPGAALTLVTDNAALAHAAAAAFAAVAFAGSTALVNAAPEGYGSSYFDRLWAHGRRVERFCVTAYKI